ncbi:MAG: hypothetical protein N4A50_03370 [Vallitalea sp.]|nr:hypothetical protein [Vallitalea sp.]
MKKINLSIILSIVILVGIFNVNTIYAYTGNTLTWPAVFPNGMENNNPQVIGRGTTIASLNFEEMSTDLTYESTIMLYNDTDAAQGGLLFRNTSNDHTDGYIALLHKTSNLQRVELYSTGIPTKILATVDKNIDFMVPYKLKVVVSGSNIKVYFNNEAAPCIEVTNDDHTIGKMGLFKAGTGTVTFDFISANYDEGQELKNYNLLSSQLGYEPDAYKYAYIRDELSTKVASGTQFQVKNADTDATVFTGPVSYWGEKWGSHWWKIDFTEFKSTGDFYVQVDDKKSNIIKIAEDALVNYEMTAIALDQLDERHNHGEPNTYLHGKIRFKGKWLTPDGTYSQGIFRDCMSNFAEIESVGMTLVGLLDLYSFQKSNFSSHDQQRMKDYIKLSADYIVACQRTTNDPKTNGRFAHSILVNTKHDGCAWAGNVYTWHDMAYGIFVLTRAYEVVKEYDTALANTYLDAAKKAYDCATYRPYKLPSELELAKKVDYDPSTNYAEALWNPNVTDYRTNPNKVPSGWNNRLEFSRKFYDKDANWQEPLTLKTRDKLLFLYSCTLLYNATEDNKYLDKAIEFADLVSERQFVDWKNPVEGVYGTFYEFEGDNEALSVESAQAGSYHMGNIDPLVVHGFMNLLTLRPEHEKAANWYNVIKTYSDNYVKKSAQLNPLGLHPLSVYKDNENGGVKFFMNLLHGATGHYGQMAGNLLDLASYMNDTSFSELAASNLNFYTGLNPGIPTASNKWKAASMINKVGTSYYNTGGEGIKGGVVNGFKSGRNWTLYSIDQIADKPDIAGAQEDWVAHSHPYVGAAAKMEADYNLNVNVYNNNVGVPAQVEVRLENTYNYQTNANGNLSVSDLPLNATGTVLVTYSGKTITKHIETMGGGKMDLDIDFAKYVELSLVTPTILQNTAGTVTLKVVNKGLEDVDATVKLSAAGISLGQSDLAIQVPIGQTKTYTINVTGGNKVMPYTVYASIKCTEKGLYVGAQQGLVE